MNFYEIVNKHLSSLNDNEKELFKFVTKNMHRINGKSIREVSSLAYVFTATFLRFVQKIGFSGYSEFQTVIKFTLINDLNDTSIQKNVINLDKNLNKKYIKNISESLRLISNDSLSKILNKLSLHPRIYIITNDTSKYFLDYLGYLYSVVGFDVKLLKDKEYWQIVESRIKSNDLIFLLSYKNNDYELIRLISDYLRQNKKPFLISITEADNSIVQNMSDINLYVFSDKIMANKMNITSHASTIAVMEFILYSYVEEYIYKL